MADTHFSGVDTPTLKTNGVQVLGTQGVAIADLAQTITATYVQAESQAMSDKIDVILAALRAHGLIAT